MINNWVWDLKKKDNSTEKVKWEKQTEKTLIYKVFHDKNLLVNKSYIKVALKSCVFLLQENM